MWTADRRAPVKTLPAGIRRALLFRSLFVQASWNYQTLIGTGFAFMLLPALRYIHREDPDALQQAIMRHRQLFNSHPYLVTVAAGAVTVLEADGTDPVTLERFKNALRGSLGSLGDQLVWLTWRPAAALLAIGVLLVGGPWWLGVLVFLVVYNVLHLWLRTWGLTVGLHGGLQVGKLLRDAPLQRLTKYAGDAGAVLAGFCTVLAFANVATAPLEVGLATLGVAGGIWLGVQVRRPVWVLLLAVWLAGVLVGVTRY